MKCRAFLGLVFALVLEAGIPPRMHRSKGMSAEALDYSSSGIVKGLQPTDRESSPPVFHHFQGVGFVFSDLGLRNRPPGWSVHVTRMPSVLRLTEVQSKNIRLTDARAKHSNI
jgi:hypothetical protein